MKSTKASRMKPAMPKLWNLKKTQLKSVRKSLIAKLTEGRMRLNFLVQNIQSCFFFRKRSYRKTYFQADWKNFAVLKIYMYTVRKRGRFKCLGLDIQINALFQKPWRHHFAAIVTPMSINPTIFPGYPIDGNRWSEIQSINR